MHKRLAHFAVLLLPLLLALATVCWLAPRKPAGPTYRGWTAAEWERERESWVWALDGPDHAIAFRPPPAWHIWANKATGGCWPSIDLQRVPEEEVDWTGSPEAVPVLMDLLQSPRPATRAGAAATLGLTTARAAALPAVPALLKVLDDPDPAVRSEAAEALLKIDRKAALQAGVKDIRTLPLPPPPE